MHLRLDVKPLKNSFTFHTKICDLIQNYVHHGENQLRQEVEYGYIFVNILWVKYDYLANNFYATILSRHTLEIDPTVHLETTNGLDFKTPNFPNHVIYSHYRLEKENTYM